MLITRHDTCIKYICAMFLKYKLSLAINEFTLRIFSVHFLGSMGKPGPFYPPRLSVPKNCHEELTRTGQNLKFR